MKRNEPLMMNEGSGPDSAPLPGHLWSSISTAGSRSSTVSDSRSSIGSTAGGRWSSLNVPSSRGTSIVSDTRSSIASTASSFTHYSSTSNRLSDASSHLSTISITSAKQFACTFCDKPLRSKLFWKSHEEEFHEQRLTWRCPDCEQIFHAGKRFREHHTKLHGCENCKQPRESGQPTSRKVSPCVKKYEIVMHDKDAWGCGFCASLLTTWEERCEHISAHFEDKNSKWNFKNVIIGLLKQPDIAEAWNTMLARKYGETQNWPQFTWQSKKCNRVRYKLETKWNTNVVDIENLVYEIYTLAEIELMEATEATSHIVTAQKGFPPSTPTYYSPINQVNASENATSQPQYHYQPSASTIYSSSLADSSYWRHETGPGDVCSSTPPALDSATLATEVEIRRILPIRAGYTITGTRKHEGGDDGLSSLGPLYATFSASELIDDGKLYYQAENQSKRPSTTGSQSSDHDSDESAAECSSPGLSDIGTIYDVSASIFSASRDYLVRRILSDFLLSLQDGNEPIGTTQQTSNLPESSSYQTSSGTQNTKSQGKKHKRETKSRGHRGQDGDGDEDEDEDRGSKKPKSSGNSNFEKLLACPFCKFNPHRYRGCYKYVLKDISRLKQHLSRCHRIPIHCAICSEVFGSEEERDEHLRELTCKKLPPVQWDGINEKQRKQLEQRVSAKMSLAANWYRIFEILFPGKPRPKSPYVGQMLSADLLALQDFFFSEGIEVVHEVVTRTLPPSLQPQEDEVQAFLETAFQDAVGVLLARWESMNQNTVSPPTLSRGPQEGNSMSISDSRSVSRRSDEDQSSTEGIRDVITPLTELGDTCTESQEYEWLEGFDWSAFIDTPE